MYSLRQISLKILDPHFHMVLAKLSREKRALVLDSERDPKFMAELLD